MFMFIVMGVGVVWIYFVVVMFVFDLFLEMVWMMGDIVVVYFEVVVVIMVLVLFG